MPRPKGSKNKPKTDVSSTAVAHVDDFVQAFSGAGSRRDRSSFSTTRAPKILGWSELNDLYLGDGFARAIVDVVAEEMTRAGIEIEDLENEDLEESIEARLEELDAMRHMNDALRWSRLFGGALVVYGLNDGGALDVPLNEEGIRSVEFVRVYDRWACRVSSWYDNPALENYGRPAMWEVTPDGLPPYPVHESRVHVFDGESVPARWRRINQGWGASVLQACYNQLVRLGLGHQWANMMLERSQQPVHGIPDLARTLAAPGGTELVQRRVDVVDMVRGVQNTVVKDAAETYEILSAMPAGITDILDRFSEALSAVTRIPVTVLMGTTPGGLNATGQADLETWYARVASMQNDILRKPLDRLVNYICLAETGRDGGDYKLCFRPLNVKSEKEVAETEEIRARARKTEAETAEIYVNIAALDGSEVREGLKLTEEYEIDAALDEDLATPEPPPVMPPLTDPAVQEAANGPKTPDQALAAS